MLDNIAKQGAFMNAFSHAFIGMAILDKTETFLMANSSFARILGYSEEELVGMSVKDVTYLDDYQMNRDNNRSLILGEHDFYAMDKRYYRKDGTVIWGHLSVSVYKENGDVYLIVQLQDITDRKKEETELKKSEMEYRQLVAEVPDPMVIHNNEKFLYINRAAMNLLNVSEKNFIGQPLKAYIHEEDWDWFHELISKVLESGEAEGVIELKLNLPEGRRMDILSSGTVINFQNQRAVQVVFRDNTAQKEFEMKSNYLLQQYEKMNLVGEFAAGVAHEIKNPLTILKGFIQLLELHKEEGPASKYEGLIFSEIDRINLMLNEFLTLARPSCEELEELDVVQTVSQVVRLMHMFATTRKVTIQISSDADLPMVFGMENKLKQAFINIIKNAIEAMPDGGTLRIGITTGKRGLQLQFIDEGEGIPGEILRKVTTPFFTTKSEGTGLGMMITNNIIHSHKGSLHIDSREGVGTTVEIQLPVT
ncbi:PAS domain S-box protein [Thalassobacillus pellis]|uniref:PAS domain S-box protein n=1 Tax=Thalassobacillus pellis TaxID=748008 RepID=UPI00196109F1|nr:PAS domain S-box protein [Thalassobacillus pellis]MBM7551988.1 PAS domain S-box-containing protein [Thalassobacillus pellis]